MVFISYSHYDTPSERSMDLRKEIENEGFHCVSDHDFSKDVPPPGGWELWMTGNFEKSDVCIVIWSKGYYKTITDFWSKGYNKTITNLNNKSNSYGVIYEASCIFKHLRYKMMESGSSSHKVISVYFDPNDKKYIPVPLDRDISFLLPVDFSNLKDQLLQKVNKDYYGDIGKINIPIGRKSYSDNIDIKLAPKIFKDKKKKDALTDALRLLLESGLEITLHNQNQDEHDNK